MMQRAQRPKKTLKTNRRHMWRMDAPSPEGLAMNVLMFVVCLVCAVVGGAHVVGAVAEQNAATAYAVVRANTDGSTALQNAIDKAAFIADMRP